MSNVPSSSIATDVPQMLSSEGGDSPPDKKENEDSDDTTDSGLKDEPQQENALIMRNEDSEKLQVLPRGKIEHFSKPLSLIQKKDLKHLYISYLREQFL